MTTYCDEPTTAYIDGHAFFLPLRSPLPQRQAARLSELPARLQAKVAVVDGCWVWQASIDRYGYGVVKFERRTLGAHRVVYEILAGSIPDGLEIDHLCRNRACVNPGHLEPVTGSQNMRRSLRSFDTRTHCVSGAHELTQDNVRIRIDGRRECRDCVRQRELLRPPRTHRRPAADAPVAVDARHRHEQRGT